MRNFFIFISSVFVLLLTACNSPFLPKEKGYANFKFPEKTYQSFNAPNIPYTFEYPTYAFVDNQINYFGENKSKDAWINIQFPSLNGTIYISYKKIKPQTTRILTGLKAGIPVISIPVINK